MSSFLKTIVLLGVALLVLLALAVFAIASIGGVAGWLLATACAVPMLGLCIAIAGGCVVLWREARRLRGAPDLFLEWTRPRRENGLAHSAGFRAGVLRRWFARLTMGHDMLPGDAVRIRPLSEILATLDEQGSLDGMPFQPEMVRFCGSEARIFRCLDKIYDYGRTKRMRRLDGCVLLSRLRCDGSAHAGCEAACYLIWKTEWLQHSADDNAQPSRNLDATGIPQVVAMGTRHGEALRCQFTELHGCSTGFGRLSLRKDLIPLLSGNYPVRAWAIAVLTRCFNAVQGWRGGIRFPPMPTLGDHLSPESTRLSAGERVVVLPPEQIARTLNHKGKNRGLWFDLDMLKHCGREYRVQASVRTIIDDATGQMRSMKTPCITLEDVDYSGEGLNFNAQHDPTFWRESWLRRADSAP